MDASLKSTRETARYVIKLFLSFFFALLGTNSSGNLAVILRSTVTVKILRIKFSLSSFFLAVGTSLLSVGGDQGNFGREGKHIYLAMAS